jgi:hypothetical protein
MMKTLRRRFGLAALAVLIGVNAWLYWPPAWHLTPAGAILRMGGKVTYLTATGHEGEPAVVLPETVTDEALEQMTALERLQPVAVQLPNSRIGNRGLASLRRLPQLRLLSLLGTKVDDEGLACLEAFANLEILNVDGCAISDRGLDHLKRPPRLQIVSLYGTQITPDGVKKLQAARPGLKVRSEYTPAED